MKQTKHTYFKMLLIVALALLMSFALVACNGDKKNKNDDNAELTDAMKQMVEDCRTDLDAMFNCFLTNSEKDFPNNTATMHIWYQNSVDIYGGYVTSRLAYTDPETSRSVFIEIAVYEDENVAKSREQEDADSDIKRFGNKVISNYTQYQQMLKCTRPSSITKFTKEQIEFMENKLHRGAEKKEGYAICEFTAGSNKYGSVLWYNVITKGMCSSREGIGERDGLYLDELDTEFININYTDDSYIKFDEKTGLTSFKVTEKVGWHVYELTEGYDDQPTGKFEAQYFYDDKIPSSLTIPTKIGDYDIDEAYVDTTYLNDPNATIKSVIITKAFTEVELSGNIKQITIPACDRAFVEITNNTALTTVNFGGTTQQWEAMQANADYDFKADNWCTAGYYDLETHEYVEKEVTFTVKCTNGNITYPGTNA